MESDTAAEHCHPVLTVQLIGSYSRSPCVSDKLALALPVAYVHTDAVFSETTSNRKRAEGEWEWSGAFRFQMGFEILIVKARLFLAAALL